MHSYLLWFCCNTLRTCLLRSLNHASHLYDDWVHKFAPKAALASRDILVAPWTSAELEQLSLDLLEIHNLKINNLEMSLTVNTVVMSFKDRTLSVTHSQRVDQYSQGNIEI